MARKINVLLVATEFAPGMIPFAVKIINTLAQDSRFSVKSLCVCSGKRTYRGLIIDEAHPTFIDYPTSKIAKLAYKFWPNSIIRSIKKKECDFSPDNIHYLTGDFSLGLFAFFNRNKKNLCYTVHDLTPHEVSYSSFLRKYLKKTIDFGYTSLRKNAKNLTTSSKEQYELLKKMYPKKNISFTPFPSLVTDVIKNGTRPVKELIGKSNYILFFGAVYDYKGVQLLIDAFEQLNIQDTNLIIAGKGIDCIFSNKNIIRLNRFFYDDEIQDLFKKAKFIVYPYISATMSGVLSLALYFKKDVLLSDVPFFIENSCKNTSFFRTNDIHDLKVQLKKMLTRERCECSSCYQDLYSDEKLTDSYYAFYQESL